MNSTKDDKSANRKSLLPMLLIACIAIAAGVYAGTRNSATSTALEGDNHAMEAMQSQLVNSTVLPDDFKTVPAFSLLQSDDQPITESSLENKWTVLFFGFTNCPDICPNTLNEMNAVVTQLAADNVTVPQVLFITVDPVRDTVEKMTEYVGYFNEDFIGVSGELTDITELTSKLGIVAGYTAATDGSSNYSVDHTASMLLIDPQLNVRAKLNAPHKADTITADLKKLLAIYN